MGDHARRRVRATGACAIVVLAVGAIAACGGSVPPLPSSGEGAPDSSGASDATSDSGASTNDATSEPHDATMPPPTDGESPPPPIDAATGPTDANTGAIDASDGSAMTTPDAAACGGCASGDVCCAGSLPCAGMCVHDCRLGGMCPMMLTCDQSSGVCVPPGFDAGGPPPMEAGSPPPPDGGQSPDGGHANDSGAIDSGLDGGAIVDSGTDSGATSNPPAGNGVAETEVTTSNAWAAFNTHKFLGIYTTSLAVGEPGSSVAAGTVALYDWSSDAGAWKSTTSVTGMDTKADDYFGSAVDLESNEVAVGAFYADTCTGTPCVGSGAVYVFARSNGTWSQQDKLVSGTQAASTLFGWSLALSGSTVAIGAPYDNKLITVNGRAGVVYIYTRGMNGKWTQATYITPSTLAADDFLGASVALTSDGTLVMGAPGYDSTAANPAQSKTKPGTVYVYSGSGSSWTAQANLQPADAVKQDAFGFSVSASATTMIAGAPYNDGAGADAGAAYIYVYSAGSWSQQAKLVASDASASAWFGYSVAAVSDSRVLVGAAGASKVYSFSRSGTTWTQDAVVYTSCEDAIGHALSASGNFAVSGKNDAFVFDLLDTSTACVGN